MTQVQGGVLGGGHSSPSVLALVIVQQLTQSAAMFTLDLFLMYTRSRLTHE